MDLPPLIQKLKLLIPKNKIKDTARKVGIADVTILNWFHKGTDPRLSIFNAALNSLGYKLKIVPINDIDISMNHAKLKKVLRQISCPRVTEHPLWWQQLARNALKEVENNNINNNEG